MTIYYLHGFNSDGDSWKATALAKHFPQAAVHAPDLPADPAEVMRQLTAMIGEVAEDTVFFGTSLGGFYALCLSAYYARPAFLFNPSLIPHETLHRGIGEWTTFTKQRPYHFKLAYLPVLEGQYTAYRQNIDPALLHFFLAEDDDILDLSSIPQTYPNAATLRWYPNTGHRFDKFERALRDIKKAGLLG